MTVTRSRLTSKAATVEKALRMSVQGVRKSKYRNKPVIVNGERFDSGVEYKRWCELVILERAGEIHGLRRQFKFPLTGSGFTVVAHYIADAVYVTKTGDIVAEDTKSEATAKLPLFRLKSKLFRDNYGYDITIHGGKSK